MQTIETIMEEMEKRVRNNEAISPASWIEVALRINLLGSELDNKIANYEAMMISIEAEYLKNDMSSAKAKTLAKAEVDYKEYLEIKSQFKRLNEFIMLAKRRAVIQDI